MSKLTENDIAALRTALEDVAPVMSAMGDEARMHLLLTLLSGECTGSRVAELTEKAAMSRASVSHHLQILKQAGLVKVRKEGTLVYYYLDPEAKQILKMKSLFDRISEMIQFLPDRTGDELNGGKA